MIVWPDLIGPLLVILLVFVAIAFVGWRARRKTAEQLDSHARNEQRSQYFKELHDWLLDKLVHDLADSDKKTEPFIKAFIQITNMSGSVDELRPIAEAYRHRRGFKNEWIGE